MRHAERCVFWKRPVLSDDIPNSLNDHACALKPGQMLVYKIGRPMNVKDELMKCARETASRLRLALVHWPSDGPENLHRNWIWAMQKPGSLIKARQGPDVQD